MTLRYDESLQTLVNAVVEWFGPESILNAVLVRDASGRLAAILGQEVASEKLASASAAVSAALGPYARQDRPIADLNGAGSARLLAEAQATAPINVGKFRCRLIDRRIVGADWLRPPASTPTGIPRLVFASLKGGVGRSTALCIIAAHLSRRGLRVLAIDFDLEAPGLGSMLLNPTELPKFGTLDYFVETGLSDIDNLFLSQLAGDSFLGADGGRVTVVPAIGQSTIENPENALGKIARAYLETIKSDGSVCTLSEKLREMVEKFEATGAYDIVLIDARAGLHETTAAALLGLGANTLMFGVDQPQTFLGYKLLMAHLGQFPVDVKDDWRERLYFVHAKASDAPDKQTQAEEHFLQLYDAVVHEKNQITEPEQNLTADDFNLDWDQEAETEDADAGFSPPPVFHVLDDSRYRDFNPISERNLFLSDTYAKTFGSLLDYVDTITNDDLMSDT